MVADILGMQGIEIAPVSGKIQQYLKEQKITVSGSLIDLTMAGTKAEIVGKVLGDLLASPDNQAVLMVVGSSAQFHSKLAVEPILQWAASPKPLAVYVVPNAPASLSLLAKAGIATFRTPESCAEAVRALLQWKAPLAETPKHPSPQETEKLLQQFSKKTLTEVEAGTVFKSLGISAPFSKLTHSAEEAVQVGSSIGYPLVAKLVSADILHKTEAGGVALNIANEQEIWDAYQRISTNVRINHPDAQVDGILIQKMEEGLLEVLIGYKIDPVVGPTVILGVGGVLAEIYQDIAIRMAPVSPEQAFEMVEEVKGLALIRGYRSLPRGDCQALAEAVIGVSRLADLKQHKILEAEINPLLVKKEGKGVVAVDGLLVLE